MSTEIQERLYNLLPAIHRIRDAERGGYALRALMALIEQEVEAVEADIDQLYEDWFIETCAPWVVPYIGDLLNVRGVYRVTEKTLSPRAFVANTLAYRRRKGTAAMLEQLARDVTGHGARVVEFFEHLATTQHLNHLRPENVAIAGLRSSALLDLVGTPFDPLTRTAEVRRIARERGRYNIPNIGLFLWRLQAYPLEESEPRRVRDGGYTFNAFGRDAPLFNVPELEDEITHLAEEIHVPGPLRLRALFDELEAYRLTRDPDALLFFDPARPAVEVFARRTAGDAYEQVATEHLYACDLSTWRRPVAAPPDGEGERPLRAMVDPVLGRLTFPETMTPDAVKVNFAYGFSGDLGGGAYDREAQVDALLDRVAGAGHVVDWQVGVSREAAGAPGVFGTLTDAVRAWNLLPPGQLGVITLMESAIFEEDIDGVDVLEVPEGSTLLLLAAGWPEVPFEDRPPERLTGRWEAEGRQPLLLGDLSVRGTAPAGSRSPGVLLLNGLSIEGELRVLVGNLGRLVLSQCTLIADKTSVELRPSVFEVNPSVVTGLQNTQLVVEIEDTICGPVNLSDTVPTLRIRNSIIDAALGEQPAGEDDEAGALAPAVLAPGSTVEIARSTVFGQTACYRLDADDCLFTDLLSVTWRQVGCIRFSFVPPGSLTPRRYRSQPDAEIRAKLDQAEKAAAAAGATLSAGEAARIRQQVEAVVKPRFTSIVFGDPGYAQLRRLTPPLIRAGAEGGREMGAFNSLALPQREENLRASLEEYLRFGLEAGVFYVT